MADNLDNFPTVTNEETTHPCSMYSKLLLGTLQADRNMTSFSLQSDTPTETKFHITQEDLCQLTANSYQDVNKPFRYLTGNFMRIFEQQMDLVEGFRTGIQKRNNILYVDPSRSSTVYLRVNGDCKFCDKNSRVRYVFTIKNKPDGTESLIEVDVKLRGTHVHNNLKLSSKNSVEDNTALDSSKVSQYVPKVKQRKQLDEAPILKLKSQKVKDGSDLSSFVSNQIFLFKFINRLDQMTVKLSQVSDQLYEMEKKLDNLESLVFF